MRRLEGKRAVVTGGGSGIGRASAIRFAREGAAVLVVARLVNTNETVAAIRAEGGVASGMITDASKEENVAAIVERCVNELGGLEVFFANIGATARTRPCWNRRSRNGRKSTASTQSAVSSPSNTRGATWATARSSSPLRPRRCAPMRARYPNAGAISYSASKAAVNNLAPTAANAFAGTGVCVNAILPGLVETQLTRKVFEDARIRGIEGKLGHVTPLKRPGRAEEIAAAAAFLASDNSSYVDGQLLSVDGGVSSTHPFGRIALPS